MIEYIKGDALHPSSDGCVLVHGCNSRGVMGSGIAKSIKETYPEAFKIYLEQFQQIQGLKLGTVTYANVKPGLIVANAITQDSYGLTANTRYVNYEAVAECFENVLHKLEGIFSFRSDCLWHTVIFPKIGAGLGGGNWQIISTIIDQTIPDTYRKICYEL